MCLTVTFLLQLIKNYIYSCLIFLFFFEETLIIILITYDRSLSVIINQSGYLDKGEMLFFKRGKTKKRLGSCPYSY